MVPLRSQAADNIPLAGHYEGTATSQQVGKLDVSLDLFSEAGHYTGRLVTPAGTYPIEGGSFDTTGLHLSLQAGTDKVAVEAVYDAGALRGTFKTPDDGGPLELRRAGEARSAVPADVAQLSKEQWHQDLRFLAQQLPKRHANAFHFTSRERFAAEAASLDQKLDTLNPDQIYVGLDRLVNLVGDGHTYVKPPPDDADLPIDLERFGEDYRVAAVADGNEAALGARVLRIGEVSIAQARERLLPLTPADESPALRELRIASFFTTGIELHGAGIIPDRNVAHYTLADDTGRQFGIDVHAVAPGEGAKLKWDYVFKKRPLFRERPDEDFWCVELKEARAVYCSFRGYTDLAAKARMFFELIARTRPEKVVVDLRLNGGGDYNEGLRYMVEPLRALPEINRKGHLFILVGVSTFSAAMSNAAHFRAQTNAILVGETIGEKPNSYQEAQEMTLPNSGWTVRYSVKFYQFVEQGENLIRPDKEIVPSWEDYRAGKDPVLAWVLDHGRE